MKKFSYLLSYLLLLLPLSIYANSTETEKTKVKEIQKNQKQVSYDYLMERMVNLIKVLTTKKNIGLSPNILEQNFGLPVEDMTKNKLSSNIIEEYGAIGITSNNINYYFGGRKEIFQKRNAYIYELSFQLQNEMEVNCAIDYDMFVHKMVAMGFEESKDIHYSQIPEIGHGTWVNSLFNNKNNKTGISVTPFKHTITYPTCIQSIEFFLN